MAGITLNKDILVYTYGQPMTALHLITEGKVCARYPGGELILGKGDVIGICELCSEIHFLEYATVEKTTFLTYPISTIETLEDFIQQHPDVSRFFLLSAFQQIGKLLSAYSFSHLKCSHLHQELTEDYSLYTQLCERYRLPVRPLEELNSFPAYLADEIPDLWLIDFYAGFSRLYAGAAQKIMIGESAASLGLLRKCSLDFRKTYLGIDEQHKYLRALGRFYFEESGNDLFDRYTALYYKLGANCEDMAPVQTAIERMIREFSTDADQDTELVAHRVASFKQTHNLMTTVHLGEDDGVSLPAELVGSLSTLLDFIGADLELCNSFRAHVQTYRTFTDKNSMDEKVVSLRRILSEEFYSLYSLVFELSLTESYLPAVVRMFLYFGYVDEELAGHNNARTLYQLVGKVASYPDSGVYTFYDWLRAIFDGKKQPSRNEFDQDYADYIHRQKLSGSITDTELRALENNAMGKVNFELKNLFPLANKITCGQPSTFCPLFIKENVLKDLNDTFVTLSKISSALQKIRQVDYTAFYRETLDVENIAVMGKEMIHAEYLPDIILMPNIGVRGSMWQEIEGRVRNSPGRMFLSTFHLEDITSTFIRLTGEFRWELCKRIQGSRWNDVSDPSLTSEYYDYVQFYRKNRDLSAEAKEKVQTSLQRAKNSFKEMFVRDYMIWILFEGNGAPRLNKVARKILFTHCPFPQNICTPLQDNPLYSDLMERRRIKIAQRLHHLNNLEVKIKNSGKPLPDSLITEHYYTTSQKKNLT